MAAPFQLLAMRRLEWTFSSRRATAETEVQGLRRGHRLVELQNEGVDPSPRFQCHLPVVSPHDGLSDGQSKA